MDIEDNFNTPETPRHYYMVAGNVIIENENGIHGLPQNAMIITDHQNIGRYQIGKAQQALQVSLFKKMNETVNVVDVLILGFIYLGHMTEAQFEEKPESLKIVERAARPSAEVIDFNQQLNDRG